MEKPPYVGAPRAYVTTHANQRFGACESGAGLHNASSFSRVPVFGLGLFPGQPTAHRSPWLLFETPLAGLSRNPIPRPARVVASDIQPGIQPHRRRVALQGVPTKWRCPSGVPLNSAKVLERELFPLGGTRKPNSGQRKQTHIMDKKNTPPLFAPCESPLVWEFVLHRPTRASSERTHQTQNFFLYVPPKRFSKSGFCLVASLGDFYGRDPRVFSHGRSQVSMPTKVWLFFASCPSEPKKEASPHVQVPKTDPKTTLPSLETFGALNRDLDLGPGGWLPSESQPTGVA